jgi:L,D-peptidoglycan transpeptidase YkuD (ErfK/YbiS/YcfS/YnhG family)
MRIAYFGLMFGLLSGSAPALAESPELAGAKIPADAEQVIVVKQKGAKPFQVEVVAKERQGDNWKEAIPIRPGVIGPKGFAAIGKKREGDGHTPSGVYRIGKAFGYEPKMETSLEYRQTTADDHWIDDADAPQYNRWVTGKPAAKSFEDLRQPAYKYAAVIEYNTNPVVPGNGSAIFLHVWSGPDNPTAGCVALSEPDTRALLKWLDLRRHPVIVLNNG